MASVTALATLPYLALLAANVGEVLELDRILVWWAVTLAVSLSIVGVAWGLGGRRAARWTGAVTTVALFLFFHFPTVVELREPLGIVLSDLRWWAGVSAAALALAVALGRMEPVQVFLGVWAPALLILPVFQLLTTSPPTTDAATFDVVETPEVLERRPNVYWFVLDGQAGPPFLRDRLGLDPEPFLDALRRRGFEVQEDATSNYPLTHLAVPSALEMEYLYEGVEEPAAGPFFERLRGHNRTVDRFLANDYAYVHAFPGLWRGSRCAGREDVCFGEHGPLGDTEWALAAATPLLEVLADEDTAASIAASNDPLQVVESVLAAAPPSPYFAFIHQLNPHPPYLRDADCGLRDVPLELADWGEGAEYGAAVTCLFDRLEEAVDRILAVDDDPVIILQGDHGPRLGLSSATSGAVLLDEEMYFSALSAIRLPEACADLDIPDDLTFVNTFRIVFACLEDRPAELLPDRHFPIRRRYG